MPTDLLKDPQSGVRAQAVRSIAAHDATRGLEAAVALAESGDLRDRQNSYTILGELGSPEAAEVISAKLDILLAGEELPGARLDLIEAAEKISSPIIAEKVAAWNATLDADNPFAAFDVALHGGDPDQGQEIYLTHAAGQCTQVPHRRQDRWHRRSGAHRHRHPPR